MKSFKATLIAFSIFPLLVKAQNYVEWKPNTKLSYENFKKVPVQKKFPQGVLDMRMGWQIAEEDGKVPELFVQNKIDQNNSWISMKNQDILKDMQLQFDLAELYSRKIRKEFETLRKNKEKNKEAYKAKFMAGQKNFQKRLKSVSGVTINQPSLYKILDKQIQDSLIIYKDYQKN